ncbi:hypothetical protein [Streptomyces sp. NPDC002078]
MSRTKQVSATVTIKNTSLYAPMSHGVRIELEGLRGIGKQSVWHAE